MNRNDFHELSRMRRKDALALLKAKQYPGAYYMLGYAVECALKACFAKKTKKHDYPDKDVVNKAYTHKLAELLVPTELKKDFEEDMKSNPKLELNWKLVTDWNESKRYERNITAAEAKDLYSACTSRTNGVLPWIMKRW